ncbi:MAG: hypothetical protein JW776_10490 [Candidatus Lokiarchaeota archaeon]|nr:hypothetical protein [Candidatus Lokiarchaeota archaeon]
MDKQKLILFLSGIALSGLLTWLLTLTNIWQLVIIAGIAAGVLNYSIGRGSLSGGIGIFLAWLGMILQGLFTNNTTALLDAFTGLLGITGFAWLIYIIIGILGFILGALGGAIGGGLIKLIIPTDRDSQ